MLKNYLIFMAMSLLLLSSVFVPTALTSGPSQPPVDTTTLYVGHVGWGPNEADPAVAYDKLSEELIFNVYENLICMGEPVTNSYGTWDVHEQYWAFSPRLATNVPAKEDITKTVTSSNVVLTNPPGSTWSDGSTCIGWFDDYATGRLDAGDVLYMIEADGSYRTWYVQSFNADSPVSATLWRGRYVFHIRTTPTIYFFDEEGNSVDDLDAYDVEYSFKRALVQDPIGGPIWMFYKPLFDQLNSDFWDTDDPDDAWNLAGLINNAIEVSVEDVIINVGIPFPDMSFKQILSKTWASIVSKEFSYSIDCWNGLLFTDDNENGYPDWWENWRHITNSPYTLYPKRYVGTGPYRVVVFDDVYSIVILERNSYYWKSWPAPNRKNFLERIDIEYFHNWADVPGEKNAFICKQIDICDVPEGHDYELLAENGEPDYAEMKTIKYISPFLSMDAVHFTFTINPASPYTGTGCLTDGDGIPTNFFNNTYVRQAFAYAWNHTKYLDEVWHNEARCRETPLIYGLIPDYYTEGSYTYDIDFDMAKQMLQNAVFDGQNVWDTGFTFTFCYDFGNEQSMIAGYMLRDFFVQLSTYDGRTGSPFTIVVSELGWLQYVSAFVNRLIPMWSLSWQPDFADADDLMRPYMHSDGSFASFQDYTLSNGWTTPGPSTGFTKDQLIDFALKTQDDLLRSTYYTDLEAIYIADVPSFPIGQPMERKWLQYWVKGWYYNAMYPSDYYYHLYKEDACWFDVTGSDIGIPDGVVNMRDIGYISGHFGAKAPDPSCDVPYDPRWAPGTYGCGGCDVYGDRKIDMRDIGSACAHFGHENQP